MCWTNFRKKLAQSRFSARELYEQKESCGQKSLFTSGLEGPAGKIRDAFAVTASMYEKRFPYVRSKQVW